MIQSYEALSLITNPQEVVVAVIDTGVLFNHLELKRFMWKNLKEIPGDG